MAGVCCCERNGAFGDEGEAHDVVHDAGVTIGLGPLVLEEGRGESDSERRNHAADHDRSHDDLARGRASREGTSAEDVGCLVERATHIDRHHAADNSAEKDDVRRAHAVQPVIEAGVDGAEERVQDEHDRTDCKRAEQRIDEHRLDAFERSRHVVAETLDTEDDVSCRKAGKERCDEAAGDARSRCRLGVGVQERDVGEAVAGLGKEAADKARRKARAVSDGHGNEAGENREGSRSRRQQCRGLAGRRGRRWP